MLEIRGDLRPLSNDILVHDMEAGYEIKKSGIIIPNDVNVREDHIKPRWAKVWKVGKNIDYVKPGQWVLVDHGRWTKRIKIVNRNGEFFVQKIDPEYILLVSDDYKPSSYRTENWNELSLEKFN